MKKAILVVFGLLLAATLGVYALGVALLFSEPTEPLTNDLLAQCQQYYTNYHGGYNQGDCATVQAFCKQLLMDALPVVGIGLSVGLYLLLKKTGRAKRRGPN